MRHPASRLGSRAAFPTLKLLIKPQSSFFDRRRNGSFHNHPAFFAPPPTMLIWQWVRTKLAMRDLASARAGDDAGHDCLGSSWR